MILGAAPAPTTAPARVVNQVWGIDPSTDTGLIIMGAGAEVIHATNIQFDPRDKPSAEDRKAKKKGALRHPIDRALLYRSALLGGIERYGRPDLVVLEDFGFTRTQGVDTIITQCFIGFVLRQVLRELGIPYIEIPPTTLKKYIGASKKEEVMMKVLARWGYESRSNDQADAYVLARIGLHVAGVTKPLAVETSALAKLFDDEIIVTHVPPALLAGLSKK